MWGIYDERGNPGQIAFEAAGAPELTTATYDGMSRIQTIAYPGSASPEVFSYDRHGNRASHEKDGDLYVYEMGSFDELLRITKGGIPVHEYMLTATLRSHETVDFRS